MFAHAGGPHDPSAISGHPELRTEIAKQYEKIEAEKTIVLAPEEGIYLSMRALLAHGDHVVAMAPG